MAQAAAWHYTDNMGWTDLALKNRVVSKYTGNIPFFSRIELHQAMLVASEAARLADEASKENDKYAEN